MTRALAPTFGASLLLHAVMLVLAPQYLPAPPAMQPPLEMTVAHVMPPTPPPAPAPPQRIDKPVAPRPMKRVAPPVPAAPPTVRDLEGEVAAPVSEEPLIFKLPFSPELKPRDDASGEGTAPAPAAGAETPARLQTEVKPEYPDEARNAGVEGTVVLRVTIGTDGSVEAIEVQSALGHGLEQAAREAVRRARFVPATRGGTAVRTVITYRYVFQLD